MHPGRLALEVPPDDERPVLALQLQLEAVRAAAPGAAQIALGRIVAGGALALTGVGIRATKANAVIGKAVEITGEVTRRQENLLEGLKAGASLMDHDFVTTGKESFAELALGDDTSLLLGSETELLIDTFIAGQGGTIELGCNQRRGHAEQVDIRLAIRVAHVRSHLHHECAHDGAECVVGFRNHDDTFAASFSDRMRL